MTTTPSAVGVNQTQSQPYPLAFYIVAGHDTEHDDYRPAAPAKATGLQELESMRRCPKFDSCSAPCCPLDDDWQLRNMIRSDPTCRYLLEGVKEAPQWGDASGFLQLRVVQVLPIMLSPSGVAPLRAALKRAAKSGSMKNPARLANLNTRAPA